MAEEESAIDYEDLLGFALVADVALVVDATGVVTSARSGVHSARHQGYHDAQLPELP
jgi:hypothetical protein